MLADVTLGVSCKHNIQALLMCLTSVLTATRLPGRIQLRLEGNEPGFNNFYLEQIAELARHYCLEFRVSVAKSTGVRDSRDWQLDTCPSRYLWMVDEDVIATARCLEAYAESYATDRHAFFAGSKPDLNNRRDYPHFEHRIANEPMHGTEPNPNFFYSTEALWGCHYACTGFDTGNVLLDVEQLRDKKCRFRLFPDQFNPSGDGTTFALTVQHAGLKGVFVPSACVYHLEKPGKGFNEFEARAEMLYRTADLLHYDKSVLQKIFMPDGVK